MASQGSGGLCDNCHKNPAEHRVTDVDKEGKKVEHVLCTACAQARGLLPSSDEKISLAAVLEELKARIRDSDRQLVCPRCQLSFADFRKNLRLGCDGCYPAFAERLIPLLKRIHNASGHVGRGPKTGASSAQDFEVHRLKQELRKAVEAEDYERAAAVRDRIRRFEEALKGKARA